MREMRKLIQARIPVWLHSYIHFIADRYGLPDSVVLEALTCLGTISIVAMMHNEASCTCFKGTGIPLLSKADLRKGNIDEVDLHKAISKILFEARKATEKRMGSFKD